MPRILFLTAGNVVGEQRLSVGREARAVRAAIATIDPDYADLRVEADVGTNEVVEIVLSARPDIIHFSGHGEHGQAMFDDGALSQATLSKIVAEVPNIWCVVLNSCFSDSIAQRLVDDGVPAVVGMCGAVSDETAIEFARFFYRALALQADIGKAVEQSRVNLEARQLNEASYPCCRVGNEKILAERSRRFARPELRARFCLDANYIPDLWEDAVGNVFVPFDLFVENAPLSAASVIYRLHESYNDVADGPEQGQFREVTAAGEKFYLMRIASEDDYIVEAYLRWNDGRVKMIQARVTDALRAFYDSLSEQAVIRQRIDRETIDTVIDELLDGNLQLRKLVSRQEKSKRKKGKRP